MHYTENKLDMPFSSAEFLIEWSNYLEYLKNNHDIELSDRRKEIRLDRLNRYSKGDEQKAISIIKVIREKNYQGMMNPFQDVSASDKY